MCKNTLATRSCRRLDRPNFNPRIFKAISMHSNSLSTQQSAFLCRLINSSSSCGRIRGDNASTRDLRFSSSPFPPPITRRELSRLSRVAKRPMAARLFDTASAGMRTTIRPDFSPNCRCAHETFFVLSWKGDTERRRGNRKREREKARADDAPRDRSCVSGYVTAE